MPQKIEFKVGLFITITSLLILASIGYVAYKKGLFSTVYTYTIASKTGENLTAGMPVVVLGFTIGRIGSLELNDQGTVLLQIEIPERHNRMIRADSKFILEKPLIGSPRIVVQTPNLSGPPLSPQTIPELSESNDINEIIKKAQPIIDKADLILAHIEKITGNLADPNGDVNRILRDVQVLVAKFTKRDSLLEIAIGDPESVKAIQETLKKLRDIAANADEILLRFDKMAGETDRKIYGPEGILAQFRDILLNLLEKLKKLDTTVDNINKISTEAADSTKGLKVLRSELDQTVTEIGNLADEIGRLIPFKSKPEIRLP